MPSYQLTTDLYIAPTPAGAYYATSSSEEGPSRQLLRVLLQHETSPALTIEGLMEWSELDNEEEALDLLYHIQRLGWVEGLRIQQTAPTGAIEDIVPDLLPNLSGSRKALLADAQGFYVSSQGFPHETAEELSALSADIASLHDRHNGLLNSNLGLDTAAWALVDAAGNGQVGFWPLFIGEHRFVLVVSDFPYLNQKALTTLVWALSIRYGK